MKQTAINILEKQTKRLEHYPRTEAKVKEPWAGSRSRANLLALLYAEPIP